jgi:hypothetical protein
MEVCWENNGTSSIRTTPMVKWRFPESDRGTLGDPTMK